MSLNRIPWKRIAPAFALVALVIGATFLGVSFRQWTFEFTRLGRFTFDIQRNYNFGVRAIDEGWLNLHEDDIRDKPPSGKRLDYPPLRLGVFWLWAKWTQRSHPAGTPWSPEYSFNAPLLQGYTALEWLGSAAALLIVLYWLRRSAQAQGPPRNISPWTGVWQAGAAFLLLWFNPGMAIVGHGWPSPNVWTAPIYLITVLLCLWDFWFIAGVVLGIGAMMQGQLLSVVALFLLWPIFAGMPTRTLRWLSGFSLATALVVSGWMLTLRPDLTVPLRTINWPAVVWVISCTMLLALIGLRSTLLARIPWKWFLLPCVLTAAVFIWPAIATRQLTWLAVTGIGSAALIALFWLLDWRSKRYLLPLVIASCLFLCIPLFGASTAWYEIGFRYGTERFPNMTVGANNLPAILHSTFGWKSISDDVFTVPASILLGWPKEMMPVEMKPFLMTLFAMLLVAACAAVAMQWRRKDRNLLVALVVPWVLFYTVCPQIIGRYSVFIAAASAICIGRNVGMALLGIFFSLLTIVQVGISLVGIAMRQNRGKPVTDVMQDPMLHRILANMHPGISWAVVVAAGIFVYVSWTSSRSGAHRLVGEEEGLGDGHDFH